MEPVLIWEDPEENLVRIRLPDYHYACLKDFWAAIPFEARDNREDDRLGWDPIRRTWGFWRKIEDLSDDLESFGEVNLLDRVTPLLDRWFSGVPVRYPEEQP